MKGMFAKNSAKFRQERTKMLQAMLKLRQESSISTKLDLHQKPKTPKSKVEKGSTTHSRKVSEGQSPVKQVIVSKQPEQSVLPIPLTDALVFDLIDTNSEESSLKGIFDETPILNNGQRDRLIRNSNTKA